MNLYAGIEFKEQWAREREKQESAHKRAIQLVDAGFKALAVKLHPDIGGDDEDMVELNAARDFLKEAVPRPRRFTYAKASFHALRVRRDECLRTGKRMPVALKRELEKREAMWSKRRA
jgi:hypothetical protein